MCLLIGVQLGEGAYERLLRHVLRLSGIPQHAVSDVEHGVLILLDQLREGVVIAAQCPVNECDVFLVRRRNGGSDRLGAWGGSKRSIKRLSSAKGGRLTVHPRPPSIVPAYNSYNSSAATDLFVERLSQEAPGRERVEGKQSRDCVCAPRVRCTRENNRGLQARLRRLSGCPFGPLLLL
jgi:hypothetical protein